VSVFESIVWAAMAGALLLLTGVAAGQVLTRPSAANWRSLAFMLLTGSSCLLLSGLPEYALGVSNSQGFLMAKVALPPLSSALALNYLGFWLGISVEDRLIRHSTAWGALFLVAVSIALVFWTYQQPEHIAPQALTVSAACTGLSCLLGGLAAVRGSTLGDPLAKQMSFACVCMTGMVAGLYAKSLGLTIYGLGGWVLTAVFCTSYFVLVSLLAIKRAKAQSKLEKLARGASAVDNVTGLPTGVELLVQVDDALWRSQRVGRHAMIIAVWVSNLYELSGLAGQTVDLEIRTTLTARMRRAVGFRNVVGLYHPRCFVVVISAVQNDRMIRSGIERLREHLLAPMLVGSLTNNDYRYQPQISFGVLVTPGGQVQPTEVMDEAEQLAQQAIGMPGQVAIRRASEAKVSTLEEDESTLVERLRHAFRTQTLQRPERFVDTEF
jgi:GGDEF domain-containing protein